ncbi:MAG: aspartate-semialdehyde dehydrogenase [Pontixanthobacter sp.]
MRTETVPASIRLAGESIAVTGAEGLTLAFGSPRDAVEREIAAVLGKPTDKSSNEECGAGPMEFSAYQGGLTVTFQDGKLTGWYLDRDEDSRDISTSENITIGSVESALTKAYSVKPQIDSTLGDEFYTTEGVAGFLSGQGDAKVVESLFAGTNCFFR